MDIKTCPYCGKKILAIAKVCKHCRQSLRDVPANGAPTTAPKPRPVPKPIPKPQSQPATPTPANEAHSRPTLSIEKQEKRPMFHKLFSPSGRVDRLEYICIFLLFWLTTWFPFVSFVTLYLWIVSAIKRNHDFNFCGWWILIPFWALVIAFIPGTKGENDYGVEPK